MRIAPILAALPLVACFAVVQDRLTNRASAQTKIQAVVEELNRIPMTLDDWHGTALELDADQREGAQLSGYALRRYVNQETGNALSLLIVCGRPGPISVHTPESCFPGAGFRLVGQPLRISVPVGDSGSADFWRAKFRNEYATSAETLLTYWSWRASGPWLAPDYPRLRFAGEPVLRKLYVVHELTALDEAAGAKSSEAFLTLLLNSMEPSPPAPLPEGEGSPNILKSAR